MPDDKEKLIHIRMYDSDRFDAATKRWLLKVLSRAGGMTETEFVNQLLDELFGQLADSDVAAFRTADAAAAKFMGHHKTVDLKKAVGRR